MNRTDRLNALFATLAAKYPGKNFEIQDGDVCGFVNGNKVIAFVHEESVVTDPLSDPADGRFACLDPVATYGMTLDECSAISQINFEGSV